jgi:PAS domain S-box-containing protein
VALAESETRYRASFDQAAVGLAHTSLQGEYIRVNRKLCDLLGYTETEMLARHFRNMTHPDDIALIERTRAMMLADPVNAKPAMYEKRYFR